MADLNEKTVTQLVDLGRQHAGPQSVPGGNVPFVLVPEGCHVQAMPELVYNDHTAKPERIKGNISVLDPESFIEYYTLFSDANSRVFADETTIKVVGVLDYHGAGEGSPRWGQHRLTLTLRQSEEWKIWTARNNKQFSQTEFAEFLEQNSIDVTNPAPAAMLEIARDLQATTEVDFASGIRMNDGQVRFKYSETTKSSVGGGAVAVPEQFTLSIPVFIGGSRVSMQALLRFRVKEGKLVFWFTLLRPEEVMRQAFLGARTSISSALSITIINGVPA